MSNNTRWDYEAAKPPSAGGTFREVATFNQLNVDNLTVYSGTHTGTIVVSGIAELSGATVLRSTLSVVGATTLNTLTVNNWSILSGPVVMRSTLSVTNGAAVGSLYVVSNTTMVGSVDCLSNAGVAGNLSVGGTIYSEGDISTNARFATRVGYVDPEVGDIKMNVSPIERNGWILCNGQQLNRSEYSDLFDLIGTTFGNGDGVNTFNVPNADGRVLGNVGGGRGNGESVGSETVSLGVTNIPAHTHSGTTAITGSHAHAITDPGHTHTQTTINDDFNNSGENPPGFTADSAGTRTWNNISTNTTGITIQTNGEHAHTFTTDGGAGLNGSAFSVMQPTLFIGYTFIFSGVPTLAL
jgi:microcystin-dependent protein